MAYFILTSALTLRHMRGISANNTYIIQQTAVVVTAVLTEISTGRKLLQ
jgi:hypothetical protein